MVKGIKNTSYRVPMSKSSKVSMPAASRKNVSATKAVKPYPNLVPKGKM